jgi:hypothetical protein
MSSCVVGVGQISDTGIPSAVRVFDPEYEPAFPEMRCPDFFRCEASCRWSETHFFQVAEHMVENGVISR